MRPDVERRAKVGVAWTASTALATQIVTFVLGVILARILAVEDFGVFFTIVVFTEVGTSVVSSGIVTALVQRKHVSDRHYTTALTLLSVLAVVTVAILIAISPWVGRFVEVPRAGKVLAAMSTYLLILPFISVPVAQLRKRIDFRSTGMADIGQQLSGGSLSVALALAGLGVWSLVIGRLCGYLVKALMLARFARWWPRYGFDRVCSRDLLGFGAKMVGVNSLNDIAINVDYFLVGKLLGEAAVGLYSRAYTLMTLPLNKIVTAMNVVMFSAFSESQDEEQQLRAGLHKATAYAALIVCPLLTGLFWAAPSFIRFVYEPKWMGSVAPLQIMCFAGMMLAIEPLMVSAIVAKGHVGFELRRQVVYVIVLSTLIALGSRWGIVGVAWGVLGASALFLLLVEQLAAKLIGFSWGSFARVVAAAAAPCLLASLAIWIVQRALSGFAAVDSPPMLAATVLTGGLCYLIYYGRGRWSAGDPVVATVYAELAGYGVRALRGALRRPGC